MEGKVVVKRCVENILGWPTDTFSVDIESADGNLDDNIFPVRTVLIFVPGNPGLIEWYIPFFSRIIQLLGPGYAVRGASYAGHSIDAQQIHVEQDDDGRTCDAPIRIHPPPKTLAWTIDGQVQHKIAFLDKLAQKEMNSTKKFIFIGHSIGCHLVQRIFLYRADFLRRTTRCIWLMPFIRMDAPAPHQQLLDLVAQYSTTSTWILQTAARVMACFPTSLVEQYLLQFAMERADHRRFTAQLLQQTQFPRNFLGLGLEEIRDVPQAIDLPGLKLINARHGVPVTVLFAGNDHWGPRFHIEDLQTFVDRSLLPSLELQYNPQLKHDFVTSTSQTDWVIDYCVNVIQGRPVPFMPQSKL